MDTNKEQTKTPDKNLKPVEVSEERKLARRTETDFMNPIVWEQMKDMAAVFIASKALPEYENAATIIMKMQAGREMGMTPLEAIKSFYFVKGVMSIFGAAAQRRLREHGWEISYEDKGEKDNESCTATIKKGKESYSQTLTFKQAVDSKWTAGTSGLKPGWLPGANRMLKLRYGAVSMLIKTYVPEVLGAAVDIKEVAEDIAPTIAEYKENGYVDTTAQTQAEPASPEIFDAIRKFGVEPDITWTMAEAKEKLQELSRPKKKAVKKEETETATPADQPLPLE